MADPVLVLLILIGSERPRTSVVSSAVADAIGRDARVLVEDRETPVPDAETAQIATRTHASVIAEISWADRERSRAKLRVYVTADRGFYDREVVFEKADAPDERDRAVGFLVGAMIRDPRGPEPPPPSAPPPPPAPPAPATPPAIRPPPDAAIRAPPRPWHMAVEAGGLATGGIDGAAGSIGPLLRGYLVFRTFSVNVGASVGFGAIDAADARSTTTRLGSGVRWGWLRIQNVTFDAGGSLVAIHHAVRRTNPDVWRDRWLPGVQGSVGAGWRMAPHIEPIVGLGAELVPGVTSVTVENRGSVAEIPPLRVTAEAGVRVHL